MKSTVIGVSRMVGVGKNSKQPYDMARVLCLSPIRPYQKENLSITGQGFEVVEVALDPSVMGAFMGMTFPCQVDLETDMQARGGKLEPVVTGIRKSA